MDKTAAKPGIKGRLMKGQAAIEYLMNYALAFLVIVVVVGILTFMVFGQMKVEQCNAPTGYICNDPVPQVFNQGGRVYMNLVLHNSQLQDIKVYNVLCTTGSAQESKETDAAALGNGTIYITSGTSATFKEDTGGKITCKSGANPLTLSAGQDFRGSVIIWYTYANDIDTSIHRSMVLSVQSTVQKA
ncbi:Uncharacterised protein [uncultured archaeon]|nr:Uncharacterised protein [uncultured archaeon]